MNKDALRTKYEIMQINNNYYNALYKIQFESAEIIIMGLDPEYLAEASRSVTEVLRQFFKKLKELVSVMYNKFHDKIYYEIRKYKIDHAQKELIMKRNHTPDDLVTYYRIDTHVKQYTEYLRTAEKYISGVFKSNHKNVDDYRNSYREAIQYMRDRAMSLEHDISHDDGKEISLGKALDKILTDTRNIARVEDDYVKLLNSLISELEKLALHEDDATKVSNMREFASVLTHRGTNGINFICTLWNKNIHTVLSEPRDEDEDEIQANLVQLNY